MHTHASARPFATRLAAAGVALLAAGGLALSGAAPALAHDQLVDTALVEAADGSPESVQLTFSDSIIEVGTELSITDAEGESIADGAPEIAGPRVTQALTSGLEAGEYAAAWRVVSSDGHPIEGAFGIEISPDGSGKLTEVAEAASEGHSHDEGDGEHSHADADEHAHDDAAADEPDGLGTGAIIAISAGAVLVVGGALAAVLVGQRRRSQGMQQ